MRKIKHNLQHQHLITCLCPLPSQRHPEVGSHINGPSEEDHNQRPDDESPGTEPERAVGAHIITNLVRTQVHIDLIRVWVLCMYFKRRSLPKRNLTWTIVTEIRMEFFFFGGTFCNYSFSLLLFFCKCLDCLKCHII